MKTLRLLSLFLFFISSYTFAQSKTISGPQAECKKLIDQGTEAANHGKYAEALEYYTKAEGIAAKHKLINELANAKNSIGNMYRNLSNYGEALGYFKEVLSIAQEDEELSKSIPVILSNIGLVYTSEKDYKTALEYYQQGHSIAKTGKSVYNKVLIALNISDLYNKIGDYANAQKYLKEVESLKKSDIFERGWKINYAESLYIEGRVEEAETIVEGILNDVDSNDIDCYVCVTELLSKIYNIQGKTDMAIAYAKEGLHHTLELPDRVKLYEQLTDLYTKKREYETALKYKDSVLLTRDSLSQSINRGLFETNKIKLRIQEYQNELNINKQKHAAVQNILIVAICFSIVLFYFIYRNLKHRIAKQKQEKVNADNEKKIYELELDNLKNSVAEKNRKLSAKALYLSGRNELIDDVITSLSAIPEVSNKKEISDYIRTLRAYIKSDEEWDDFITYFEQVNPEFIKTLTNKYPDLNTADIRFLCYVYMNLDVKEIGNIYNITYNAAVKRLRRIREKMQINKDISLHEYLVSLH